MYCVSSCSVFFCNGAYFVDGILVTCVLVVSVCVYAWTTHTQLVNPNRIAQRQSPQPNLNGQTPHCRLPAYWNKEKMKSNTI
jgi:hypothetical protein